jgi:hypothetical protein
METIRYSWNTGDRRHAFDLVFVTGTQGHPYSFGEGGRSVEDRDFFIGAMPVTQALWARIMGAEARPAAHQGPDLPVENVSWDEITRSGGFLDRINKSPVRDTSPRLSSMIEDYQHAGCSSGNQRPVHELSACADVRAGGIRGSVRHPEAS